MRPGARLEAVAEVATDWVAVEVEVVCYRDRTLVPPAARPAEGRPVARQVQAEEAGPVVLLGFQVLTFMRHPNLSGFANNLWYVLGLLYRR